MKSPLLKECSIPGEGEGREGEGGRGEGMKGEGGGGEKEEKKEKKGGERELFNTEFRSDVCTSEIHTELSPQSIAQHFSLYLLLTQVVYDSLALCSLAYGGPQFSPLVAHPREQETAAQPW